MIRALYIILFCTYFTISNAQMYVDRSDLLPNPWASGQTMDVISADLNMDGFMDLVLANEFQKNTLLMGSANGTFTYSAQSGMNIVNDSEDVVALDIDQDGDLDLIFCSEDDVTFGESRVHELYINENGNYIRSNTNIPDTEANAVIAMDVNQDGLEDLLFGNNGPVLCMVSKGDGSFEDESWRFEATNKTTQDLHAFDADGDGDLDVFEANENGNLIYINEGGNFALAELQDYPQSNIETRKVDSGDFDGDGDMDLFLSNVAFIPGKIIQNQLWQNDGNGQFANITNSHLPNDVDHTIDGIFSDVDLDGDLDLLLANVFGPPCKILIYENGRFEEQTTAIIGQYYYRDALSILHEDLNGDGFKDIYIADRNTNSGNKDLLLLYDMPSSQGEAGPSPINGIQPNPVIDQLQLDQSLAEFAITNIHGQTFYSGRDYIENTPIDLSGLSAGLYFFEGVLPDGLFYQEIFVFK